MNLSEQGMEKGGCVVTGKFGIPAGGWWLVEERVEETGRTFFVCGRVRGAEGTSGVLPYDCTAGGWWQGSESGCRGVLGLVWQPVDNRRVLGLEFDLAWMFWRVWGQTFDMLRGRELRLGLDWERSVEKCQGRECELFDFGWDELIRWLVSGTFVLWVQLLLDKLSELM